MLHLAYCRPSTPSPLCLSGGGLVPPQVLPKLRGEYGTSEKGESWTQRGARDRYDGNEDRTRVKSDGKEKERKLHCFFSSHQSYCPLSLTINSNIPQKVIASDWGQGSGGGGCTRTIDMTMRFNDISIETTCFIFSNS